MKEEQTAFKGKVSRALEATFNYGHGHCTEDYCDAYWYDPHRVDDLLDAHKAELEAYANQRVVEVLKRLKRLGTDGRPGIEHTMIGDVHYLNTACIDVELNKAKGTE